RDGTEIGAAIYAPEGGGRYPALLAASPYRFDNNVLPAGPQFLWRETGPIDFYVKQGYAYVHMDVRGSGKSGGEFEFLGPNEQRDLYDVIQWIAAQPWSNGKVGGFGQSYFCMSQWWMGIMAPPALACLGAYDGLNDPYRASCYQGGIPGQFFPGYWWNQNRIINRFPASGSRPREQATDLDALISAHPTYDEFWRARSASERLHEIKVPVYSVGIWGKVDLHTRGNIDGFRRARGPRKLQMRGPPNAWAANAEFNGVELHEKVLLPFYDRFLKGKQSDWDKRPGVEYFVRGANALRTADTWPPAGVQYKPWHLSAQKSGSVTSLNDGSLALAQPAGGESTAYTYPNPGWVSGVVGFGPSGPPNFDPARRVLTFTSAPLERDLEIAGPIKLVLHASSTQRDTDFVIKLSEQYPQSAEERGKGINPAFQVVTKGWLRASHRALDESHSTEMEPYHPHTQPEPLKPGEVYRFDISLEPNAYRFKQGNRIRLEIVNGDSPITDVLWTHYYQPNKIGQDTLHHSARYLSALVLPVIE
ncbi:MAG TPA: CocE/NonD family hydrolase, partial [Burkholderiales bacterium]|nr:CocE/NonD family hydrolase [Burkholderiales bacterium]